MVGAARGNALLAVAILLHQLDVKLRCPRAGGLAVDLASVGEHRFRGHADQRVESLSPALYRGLGHSGCSGAPRIFYLEWVQVRLTDFVEPADPGAKPRLMFAEALHRARLRDSQIRCCWSGSV